MEDNKKQDIDVNEAVECSEDEKKLSEEEIEGIAGGCSILIPYK